jgi:Flp pilus assembly protein TadG
VFVLIGGVDLARGFTALSGVQSAARGGAEAAALGRATTDADTIAAARDDLDRTPGVDASLAAISVTRAVGPSGEQLVTVTVHYTFRTVVAWPVVPNTVVLDRSTTMRSAR